MRGQRGLGRWAVASSPAPARRTQLEGTGAVGKEPCLSPKVISCRLRAAMWLSPRAVLCPGDWSQRNPSPSSLLVVRKLRGCCTWARPRGACSHAALSLRAPVFQGAALGLTQAGLHMELDSFISFHKKTHPRGSHPAANTFPFPRRMKC